jgi:hypothetical protein
MRLLALVVLVALVLDSCFTSRNTCRGANGWHSEHFINGLRSSTKAGSPFHSGRLSIPVVPPSDVSLVTDPAICARAYAAIDTLTATWAPVSPAESAPDPGIYLIKVGDWHAIVPLEQQEHYTSVFIFGPRWDFRFILAM